MVKLAKKIFRFGVLFIIVVSFYSCATTVPTMSPTDVKLMTSKQYEESYEMVYKSAMSLFQSESFIIEETDMDAGLLVASKRMQNKNADLNRFLWGSAKDASTARGVVIIDKVNDDITEVKITVYEGSESSSNTGWGGINQQKKEQMVYEPEVYSKWFSSLSAEIERRKALR